MTMMKLLRVYTDETAYFGDRKVFELIAERARDARLGGATVIEAMLGIGRSAHTHRRHILENDRSVVIEIVDEDARLRAFIADLRDITGIGLMTLEAIEVIDPEIIADASDERE
jgi:PII-like signaling protein